MIVSFWDGLTDDTFIPHLDPKKNGRTFHEILFLIEILMSYDIIPGSHKSSFPESQTKNRWAVVFFPQASSAPLGFLKPSQTQGCLLFSFWIGGLELNVPSVTSWTKPRAQKNDASPTPRVGTTTKKTTTQRLTRASSCWFYFVVFPGLRFFEIPHYWNHQ